MTYKTRMHLTLSLAVLLAGGVVLFAAPTVLAREGVDADATTLSTTQSEDKTSTTTNTPADTKRQLDSARERLEKAKTEAQQRRKEAVAKGGMKLDAAKLKVCQNREARIGTIMERIGKRGDNNIALISTISDRVQAYVTAQKLTVDNYAALVTAVNAAKTTAQGAADAADAARPNFACNGPDPAGAATSFKDLVQARNDAMKAYRDSVKALVKAVKTAAQAAKTQTGGGAQ